jgi:hypothetical protein
VERNVSFERVLGALTKFEKTQQGLEALPAAGRRFVWRRKNHCLNTLGGSTHFGVDLLMAALQMSLANPLTKFSQT